MWACEMSVSIRTGIPGPGEIPVAPFREAFLRLEPGPSGKNGIQPQDAAQIVAERLGWFHHEGHPDGPRVRRVLGLKPYPAGHGKRCRTRQEITYAMALRLCKAMDLDPVDFDL